ncbi:MAG: membrane protein, partial [Flavobacterium sp.]|nr:membrane protein [Aeromicrobium sp.]
SSFPQLARVIVSYNTRVGFATNLADALTQVFGPGGGATATPPAGGGASATTAPSATPTTAPPSTSAAPSGSGTAEQAVVGLSAALAAVRSGQTSGDLGRLGTALTQLEVAVQAYQQATGQTVSPSATPTG